MSKMLFAAAVLIALLSSPADCNAAANCVPGFVWRNAFDGDAVCVTLAARTQAAQDNALALSRRRPEGGVFGPDTCIDGYVWRNARSGDIVCVTPAVRAQVAQDNATAAARAGGTFADTPIAGTGSGATSLYRTSAWSAWTTRDGVQYRYRWGWDPTVSSFATNIDALFEITNPTATPWQGSARATTCVTNRLGPNQNVALSPNQHVTIGFKTDNCGTLAAPFFKGSVVRSSTY